MKKKQNVIILGAGPSGLTAGFLLREKNIPTTILEADSKYVGGLAKTVQHKGHRFDIGGHRFYTKSEEVKKFWNEILPGGMKTRKRVSRIFFKGLYFSYPIQLKEVLLKFGLWDCLIFLTSFVKAKTFPPKDQSHFKGIISAQFGEALFNTFFKGYTEKVWGLSCEKISSDWATQRIGGLSPLGILKSALSRIFNQNNNPLKTLITEFQYPDLGPGALWETCAQKFQEKGGELYLGKSVIAIFQNEATQLYSVKTQDGHHYENFTDIISTIPLKSLLSFLEEKVPLSIQKVSSKFSYRDFITVAVMYKGKNPFHDNWLYIHEEKVQVSRIQNYRNWSETMVPDSNSICLGLEYFCQRDDPFWNLEDKKLLEIAINDLEKLKLVHNLKELKRNSSIDFKVIRVPKAYPIYDRDYQERVHKITSYIKSNFEHLHLCGRNGIHRYNNQDHSIMTSMIVVENILTGTTKDPLKVNQDAIYLEK